MSTIGGLARGHSVRDVDGLDAVMRHGGAGLRRLMGRTERHLERVTAEAGAPLASHANATIVAGGKRLRPLLVLLAAESAGGPPPSRAGEEQLVRAAVAVELVHSATLVHDDLIDGAQLRRGHPTVAAVAGREVAVATGDLLFSRAFAELARNDDSEQLSALSEASSALAAGELLQREDAYARARRGEALSAPLRAEDSRAVRSGLPSRGPRPRRGARRGWPPAWASSRGASVSPSRCSTTSSTCPAPSSGRASRVAPTCSTAR